MHCGGSISLPASRRFTFDDASGARGIEVSATRDNLLACGSTAPWHKLFLKQPETLLDSMLDRVECSYLDFECAAVSPS
jgi:hypothetical protein